MFKMSFLNSLALGSLLGYHAVFTGVIALAYLNGGIIAIDVNKYGEGLLEIALAVVLLIWGIWLFFNLHKE